MKKRDLLRLKIGRWSVVGPSRSNNGRIEWKCLCDCGTKRFVQASNLTGGASQSCGCLDYDRKTMRRLLPHEPALRALLGAYQYRARRKGYVWELDEAAFTTLTSGSCFWCGEPPCQKRTARTRGPTGWISEYIYNGIDRMDNEKGYTLQNSVSCCKRCNVAKGPQPAGEFLVLVGKIARNHRLGQ